MPGDGKNGLFLSPSLGWMTVCLTGRVPPGLCWSRASQPNLRYMKARVKLRPNAVMKRFVYTAKLRGQRYQKLDEVSIPSFLHPFSI